MPVVFRGKAEIDPSVFGGNFPPHLKMCMQLNSVAPTKTCKRELIDYLFVNLIFLKPQNVAMFRSLTGGLIMTNNKVISLNPCVSHSTVPF